MAEPLPVPLLVTAKSEERLRESAGHLADHLDAHSELDPRDVAMTLQERPRGPHRAAVLGIERDDLAAGLAAAARGESAPGLRTATATEPRIAFLFSGQGAQRPGMGKGLHAAFAEFAASLDDVCDAFDPHLERPLREVMWSEPGSPVAELLDRTDFTQAALFALEVSLYRLAERFGLRADAMIGHSIGELAAIHASGALPLADACALVVARGQLMAGLPAGGAMLAVRATEAEAEESLAGFEGRISLAAANGPRATVISGDEDAVDEWERAWDERSKTTRLRVSHAFHSHRMDPMLDELAQAASSLRFAEPSVPVVSNRSGEPITAAQIRAPEYWAGQAREAVRFAAGVEYLRAQGTTQYLELGPAPVLAAMAAECLEEAPEPGPQPLLAAAMRRRGSEPVPFLRMLTEAQLHGAEPSWEPLLAGARRVELPG